MHAHDHDIGNTARGRRFDPARAQRLDDPARLTYLPPERIVAFVDAPPGALVLDFGAGTGTFAIAFSQHRPDCRVLALDIQPEMLDLLRAKPEAARVESGGLELLTRYAGRIDRIFALNVLHELEDCDLRDLFAAVAPHARLAFIDWNADVERPSGPAAKHLYGPAEAAAHMSALGLVVDRTELLPYHYALAGVLDRTAG